MPIKIVSDLHSAVAALRREVTQDDTLLLLGDLINIIDYTAMDGILVDIFGAEAVQEVIELRAQKRFDEARVAMVKRREGMGADFATNFQSRVFTAYQEVMEALPDPTYLILGNVDAPGMIDQFLRPGIHLVDGKVIELEGLTIGFLGGGLPTPLRVAGEIPEEEYNAKVDALGYVDIVCSHVPPDIPELTFDTLARRHERGSARLLEYIKEVQPLRVYYGHIHQPLVSSTHVGRTHILNTGYFRRTGRALELMR
jgi:Icc-related predicted phosphoesterase